MKRSRVSQFVQNLGYLKGRLHKKCYPLMWNLIDSHDTARFLHLCDNKKKQHLAAAFQLLLPGMPMIYYGDEFAMPGANDPDCRRGMYWDEEYQDKEMFDMVQTAAAGSESTCMHRRGRIDRDNHKRRG